MSSDDDSGVILISTFSDEKFLLELSKSLIVNKKLCACVNYTKVTSCYMWDSKFQQEQEFIAFFKTTSRCIERLKFEIKSNHPYTLPEIVVINMSYVSPEYLNWLKDNTASDN